MWRPRASCLGAALAALLLHAVPAHAAEGAAFPEPPRTRSVPLGNPELVATPQGRANLKYLSYCALDDRTTLVAEHEGERYEFPGVVGLAPNWYATDLTETEQHWVSACMLSLRNHFGAAVEVSMWLPETPNETVKKAWMQMDRQYPVPEGRFFGNLFSDSPTAYVCSGTMDPEKVQWLRTRKRVCALPSDSMKAGAPNACGIVHVGACGPQAYTQGGVHYRGSIQVFLPE